MRFIYTVITLILFCSAIHAYTDAQIDNKISNLNNKIADVNAQVTALNSQLAAANSLIESLKTRIANPDIQVITAASMGFALCPAGYKLLSCYVGGDNGKSISVPVTGVAGPYPFTVLTPSFTQRLWYVTADTSNPMYHICRCFSLGESNPSNAFTNKCTATCMKI
jgi:hypothetical protein